MERIPITRKGYEALKAELERIKKVDRPQNIDAIEEARAHGDLSENAEYEAAKDRQQFINARISELEYKLGNADIIDPDRRKQTLQRLNKMAMDEQIVWIPLHYQEDLYAIQKNKGISFSPRPDRWMVYKEMDK